MNKRSAEARGACNCGAVSFRIKAELPGVIICHCSICRRATGANGIAVIVVDNDKFEWTSDKDSITSWKKPDADWEISFCRHCGSPVPGVNNPNTMFVPAGLVTEGGEQLQVTDHIFVDSRAAWDEIGDGGRRHPTQYEA
jgi:hypothetical protein